MLGGIIGDLAASTYLRDPNCYYRQLIDEKVTLLEYGLAIIISCSLKSGHAGEKIQDHIAVEVRDYVRRN